jgi:hypothetical protein
VTGDRILQAATWSTVVLAAAAVVAVGWTETMAVPYAVLGILAFLAGCGAFLWSFAIALGRSRSEELSVAGVFFLAGSAPKAVQWRLVGALVGQSVIVVAAAAAEPFTAVAFGVLAPMLGLGLMGLWGARYGTYPERDDQRGRRSAP